MRPLKPLKLVWLVLALFLAGLGLSIASDYQVAVVTAHLTSAEHETAEGYFALGQEAIVIAKPGSDLHRWLVTHRGLQVRLTLIETAKGRTE
jgi:hypothetical protein